MKRMVWFALLTVFVLSGCAQVPQISAEARVLNGFDPKSVSRPDPYNPNVFVNDGKIVVDQEPIVVKFGVVKITWALPSDPTYFFFNKYDAIKIIGDSPYGFTCDTPSIERPKSVTCSYTTKKAVTIKYAITVHTLSGTIESVDPHMDNW